MMPLENFMEQTTVCHVKKRVYYAAFHVLVNDYIPNFKQQIFFSTNPIPGNLELFYLNEQMLR